MSKIMVRIHDIETGEVVDREATAQELAQMQADIQAAQAAEAIKSEQEATKQAVLERLGITADEVATLLA